MKKKKNNDAYSIKSFLIHGRQKTRAWDYTHHIIPPQSCSTAYRLDTAERGAKGFAGLADPSTSDFRKSRVYVYERMDEPARSMLEDQLAYVEGGEIALCFASGMAAIAAAVGINTKSGDKIIAHHTLYGCTYSLFTNWLPRFQIQPTFIDMKDRNLLKKTISPMTKVIYFETPVNPTLEQIDIRAICQVVKSVNRRRKAKEKILVIMDNTFATPFCQRPLSLGVDIVVNSLTKNIGGFGTDIGGVVVAPKKYKSDLFLFRKDFGGVMPAKSAWPILVYGLSSLDLRARKQQATAIKIAEFLEKHKKVKYVRYPGLRSFPQRQLAMKQMRDFDGNFAPGIMIYFVLKGSREQAFKSGKKLVNTIAKKAYALTLAVSLGQIRTLIEMPSSMTHSMVPEESKAEGEVDPGGIRLAIGLEEPEDIIKDLSMALSHI